MEIRNIAIIAHVDHGKTSLTNSLMKQSGLAEDNFTMDTNELEKKEGLQYILKILQFL